MGKYIVDYKVKNNLVEIYNNQGESAIVKKNRRNIKKIDKQIVECKVKMMQRINEYEKKAKERSIVFAVNSLATILSGCGVVLSFFTGYIPFIYASLIVLSISIIPTLTKAVLYSIDVREISELKRITGYHLNMEFTLPKLKKAKDNV